MRSGRADHRGARAAGAVALAGLIVAGMIRLDAQQPAGAAPASGTTKPYGSIPLGGGGAASSTDPAPALPTDYVIGPEDILSIKVVEEPNIAADVIVGPDGSVSLPLINSIHVAGLTVEQLRSKVTEGATKFVNGDPTVLITVKAILSRSVCVSGEVKKPGKVALLTSMTVLELITNVGGLTEYANKKNLVLIRKENGKQRSIRINFDDIQNGKNLDKYNLDLKPGDCVSVPG